MHSNVHGLNVPCGSFAQCALPSKDSSVTAMFSSASIDGVETKTNLVTLRLSRWVASTGCSQNGIASKAAAEASFDACNCHNCCSSLQFDNFNAKLYAGSCHWEDHLRYSICSVLESIKCTK